MDPDELLKDIESQFTDMANAKYSRKEAIAALDLLLTRCESLSTWICRDGFPPKKWVR